MKVGDLICEMQKEGLGLKLVYVCGGKVTLTLSELSGIWKYLNQDIHCFQEPEKEQAGNVARGNIPESEQYQSSGEKPEEANPLDVTDHPVSERNTDPTKTKVKIRQDFSQGMDDKGRK
jgi:hypothetical protein